MYLKNKATIGYFKKLPVFCFLALVLLVAACKKDKKSPAPHQETDEITKEGVTTEPPKTATIGTAGGKLTSRDGKLEINIPQGALTTNTEISVVAISNTSSAGFGLNYRLSPHINFTKPVKLTFSYASSEDSISAPATLGIISRNEKGMWELRRRSKLDQSNKTISVETTHFSDWAAARMIKLSPAYSEIEPKGSVKITPYACVALKEIFDLDKVFNPNGPDESLTIVEPYELPSDYVVDMYVIGSGGEGIGQIKATGISSVIYTATGDAFPKINPVTIAFPLTTKNTTMILSAKVKVANHGNGIYIKMGGKEYKYDGIASITSDGQCNIEFTRNISGKRVTYGGMSWNTKIRTHPWNENSDFWWEPEDMSPRRVFQHLYNDGRTYSAGFISPAIIDPPGGLVMGNILIETSGATNTESGNGEYLGASRIEGAFKVQREY